MGKDPNSDIAAAKASGDEDMEASVSITSSIVTEQFSSSFNESVELDETNAVMSPGKIIYLISFARPNYVLCDHIIYLFFFL